MDFLVRQAGKTQPNFITVETIEEANQVDMDQEYTYLDGATKAIGKMVFKRRQRKKSL